MDRFFYGDMENGLAEMHQNSTMRRANIAMVVNEERGSKDGERMIRELLRQ